MTRLFFQMLFRNITVLLHGTGYAWYRNHDDESDFSDILLIFCGSSSAKMFKRYEFSSNFRNFLHLKWISKHCGPNSSKSGQEIIRNSNIIHGGPNSEITYEYFPQYLSIKSVCEIPRAVRHTLFSWLQTRARQSSCERMNLMKYLNVIDAICLCLCAAHWQHYFSRDRIRSNDFSWKSHIASIHAEWFSFDWPQFKCLHDVRVYRLCLFRCRRFHYYYRMQRNINSEQDTIVSSIDCCLHLHASHIGRMEDWDWMLTTSIKLGVKWNRCAIHFFFRFFFLLILVASYP